MRHRPAPARRGEGSRRSTRSTEAALVLALSRGDLGPVLAAGTGADWRLVGELACRHGVAGLAWALLPAAPGESAPRSGARASAGELPGPLAAMLPSRHRAQTYHNVKVLDAIVRLERELEVRQVATIYFKGPWMVLRAYPDLGARLAGDIDLGIEEKRYAPAVEALAAAGYSPTGPLPSSGEEALRRAHYGRQLSFTRPGRPPVELHFRWINIGPPAAGERWLWQSSRELDLGQAGIRVPGPEAMLLHLLLNANKHAFSRLRYLHDIRWALAADEEVLDVERLLGEIRKLRAGPSAYHALLLAREIAGARVPEALLDRLEPSRARRAVFSVVWRLPKVRRLEHEPPRRVLRAPLLYLLEMGNLRDKVRFLLYKTARMLKRRWRAGAKSVRASSLGRIGPVFL